MLSLSNYPVQMFYDFSSFQGYGDVAKLDDLLDTHNSRLQNPAKALTRQSLALIPRGVSQCRLRIGLRCH